MSDPPMDKSGGNVTDFNDKECKIAVLNCYCLQHVFSFLSKKQLIGIERVSKLWQSVSLKCWTSLEHVNVGDIIDDDVLVLDHEELADKLECILKRCGKYVKSLNVNVYKGFFNHQDLFLIGVYCTSLQRLEAWYFSLRMMETFGAEFPEMTHVKELKLVDWHRGRDQEYSEVFSAFPNLKSLHLTDFSCMYKGKCFETLDTYKMEKFVIEDCYMTNIDHVVSAVLRMKRLKYLKLSDFRHYMLTHEQFGEIIQALPKVQHLTISGVVCFVYNFNLSFGKLNNLVSLDISNNQNVDDSLLKEISFSCPNVETLNISAPYSKRNRNNCVTDVGIYELARLRHLKNLTLNYQLFVTDSGLEAVALPGHLIKLEIKGNDKITDVGCGKVLFLCENLEYLDLRCCSQITGTTIRSAEAAVKCRTDNKKLLLFVEGTKITSTDRWSGGTSLLVVCSGDFLTDYDSTSDNDDDSTSDDNNGNDNIV